MKRIIRFAIALFRFVVRGHKVDDKTFKSRMEKCEECINEDDGTCTICGCRLKWKAKMDTENCPINMW